jgi:hypothetical protein
MSAEPSPPGPPDDRLAAVERRVDALEYHRDHEAPHALAAARLGLEIVQQETRDASVKLTRVIQRQDQDGAAVREVAAVQQEQGRVLDRLGRVMERHGRELEAHSGLLRDLAGGQRRHGETLAAHTEALSALAGKLDEVLRRLPPSA